MACNEGISTGVVKLVNSKSSCRKILLKGSFWTSRKFTCLSFKRIRKYSEKIVS